MDLSGGVAAAGAVAVLVSSCTGFLGWQLSRRSQEIQERRQAEIERAPYLQQLQDWSMRLMAEEAAKRAADRAEFETKRAADLAECERRIARAEVAWERQRQDLEAQWGARVLVAQRREEAWRRFAAGEGEPPP